MEDLQTCPETANDSAGMGAIELTSQEETSTSKSKDMVMSTDKKDLGK
jgi:hypothetical protein